MTNSTAANDPSAEGRKVEPGNRILCLIPTLNDDPEDTINSLSAQTIAPNKIIVICGSRQLSERLAASDVCALFVAPDMTKDVGTRIMIALNFALESVRLNDYDYIMRVDADMILPSTFIESYLPHGKTIYFGAGPVFLFSTISFMNVFGRRFVECNAEDMYTFWRFQKYGYKLELSNIRPINKNLSRKRSYRYFFDAGSQYYLIGYELVHYAGYTLFQFLRQRNLMEIFRLAGYISAMMTRRKKLDVADYVWSVKARFTSSGALDLFRAAVRRQA